ncbi:HAMP domain-containing sensor histidine kinase [Oceanobacillus halophilus]|uniref:histidine kinase n=1 Tax=Oceanobacillus halophilus TaxID=930130 RepID=A0A495A6S0_9BACI|nr:HAMP domain-containing sensor histidine kinase [Oceanobacillus halophilus]RKQ34001.1 sensor histidine kinase [Oceanobacillus halophilus]
MKIKNWLIISYLIVMLLPIVAIYLLYINLSDYDSQQDLKEYLEFQELVSSLEKELQDTSLYEIQPEENYQHLRNLTRNNLKIDLYRYDGITLFSSMDTPGSSSYFQVNKEKLFQNLNEYQKNPRTYTTKKLVFNEENQLVGLYEITMGRNAWVETTSKRTVLMLSILVAFFIILYAILIWSLNRKLNRPLHQLQEHMKAFAEGKDSEQELVQSKDEIGVLISHFEDMKAQIKETREALTEQQQEKEYMVASLSHDLKTPLTVIRTYTEALENHQLSEEERREYQTILNDKLDHMKQMIDDLSVFTALQSSENMLEKVKVNGNEFFEMLFSGYEEPCARKGIELSTELYVRNSYHLDPKQMIRLIDNLMDNSIRYTPNNHSIWLSGISSKSPLPHWVFSEFQKELDEWRKDGTVILIQNEGEGIKESNLEKVFQPFYQNDASRGKGATSGLGLSIAKIIIEKHDGKMNIWSTENKGTLIACWLKERG